MEGYESMTSNQLPVSASSAVLRARRATAMPETEFSEFSALLY
jgi:hypothetical protein